MYVRIYVSVCTLVSWQAVRIYQPPNQCIILWRPTLSSPQLLGLNPSKAWMSGVVLKWSQGALLGGLGCVLCRAWRVLWGQHGLLILKAKPARQLVDNAYLSWTWSNLREVFMLKAGPSWVKLRLHEWKRLRGFTVRGLFNQTSKQTDISTCVCIVYWIEVN